MDAETLGWIVASGSCTAVGGRFLLLVPALERGGVREVLAGFGLGAITLLVLDRYVPHAHERMAERGTPRPTDSRHRAGSPWASPP